jgi:hypothetical protein
VGAGAPCANSTTGTSASAGRTKRTRLIETS